MLSLGLFLQEETVLRGTAGTLLCTKHRDGNRLHLEGSSVHIGSAGYVGELEAVQSAVTIAGQLESAKPPFNPPLVFDPNLVFLLVGKDSEGNAITYGDFEPNAAELQKALYGGGNFAYYESSGEFNIFLGLTKMFRLYRPNGLVGVGGKARRAASLEDLLARLRQNPQ